MPNLSLETYLKRICQISARQGDRPIPAAKLAEAVRIPVGTCTNVLLALKEAGLAVYQPYEGVMLTEAGRVLALRALRRQRLVEQFLARTLNLGDDEVRREAEQIEPVFGDALVERIDEFLGFPPTCPHGDPIPRAEGTAPAPSSRSLTELTMGKTFRLVRVLDQTPDFLRYLSQQGLTLDVVGEVVSNQVETGIVSVRTSAGTAALPRDVAAKLLVMPPHAASA